MRLAFGILGGVILAAAFVMLLAIVFSWGFVEGRREGRAMMEREIRRTIEDDYSGPP